MKRAAQLLLLLLVAWLVSAAPSTRLLPVGHGASAVRAEAERASAEAEHALVELGTLQVARAPLVARVPAPVVELSPWAHSRFRHVASPPDLRHALRRVLVRRRLPRLAPEEPPWC